MLENPGDERRLCNGRDDTHGPTAAARTASQIDREHPAQPLHPAHRGAGLDLNSVLSALGRGRRSGDDVIAMFGIRGEQTVIAQQMHARARHQGGETRDKVQRLEQHVGGAVGERVLGIGNTKEVFGSWVRC